MYLMIYEEQIEDLKLENENLHKKVDLLEQLVEEQNELIFNLKKTYYNYPDDSEDSEGESSDFFN